MMMSERLDLIDRMIVKQFSTLEYGRVRVVMNGDEYEQEERNRMS